MESLPVFLNDINIFVSTVVEPDPNGSETYRRIWIRFCNEFEVKLLRKTGKMGQFLIKKTQFKNINTFLSKNIPMKRLYFVIMSNLTHLDAVLWIRIRSDPEFFAGSIPLTNGSGSGKPNTITYGSYVSGTMDFQ
jgi:hypothetical protein